MRCSKRRRNRGHAQACGRSLELLQALQGSRATFVRLAGRRTQLSPGFCSSIPKFKLALEARVQLTPQWESVSLIGILVPALRLLTQLDEELVGPV